MAVSTSSGSSGEIMSVLRDLREEAMLPLLAVLFGLGCLVLAGSLHMQDPDRWLWLGLALYALPVLVWALHRRHPVTASWVLVAGCLAAVLMLATFGGIAPALCLLAWPTGIAALEFGMPGGVAVATASTILLWSASPTLLPGDSTLRVVAGIGVWGAVGLLWLATHPLVRTLRWSWFSYEQGQQDLERTRDYQVQLKQTLADLADANLQLTRLNRLAQGLREAAEEARRAKEQFVANVSHELRTPLNMIIGFSEMVLQAPCTYGRRLPSALLADLEIINRNSQHLSSLINDVLDLSQIEARQVPLTKERVSLREIVEAAVGAVRPLFESKRLYLNVDLAAGLPEVMCDRTRICEVVLNLLSNAGRFTEQGGVHVRAWPEADSVVVCVADTGPGIAAHELGRVFEPFQQIDGSLRRRHSGTGLGLSISKAFVELHGGRIWLESQPGHGTAIFFRLPCESPAPSEGRSMRWVSPFTQFEERSRPSLAPRATVRPRFVVLDEGGALLRLVTRYMHDADIVPVGSLEEAVADMARVPANMLLVNEASVGEGLQRVSGSPALAQGTPAVICSVPGIQVLANALGVRGYLVKPVARDALLAALDGLHLRGKTILIVDDEPDALRLFRRMLVSSGRNYRILTVADGEQALGMLREEHPDAVLLDLVMPNMDGFRFLEVKAQDPALVAIPVLIISARDPAGQPIVTNALAVTRDGGLSAYQLLACIDGLTRSLAVAGQADDPAPPAAPPG